MFELPHRWYFSWSPGSLKDPAPPPPEGIFLISSHSALAVAGCQLFDLTSSITWRFLSSIVMSYIGCELSTSQSSANHPPIFRLRSHFKNLIPGFLNPCIIHLNMDMCFKITILLDLFSPLSIELQGCRLCLYQSSRWHGHADLKQDGCYPGEMMGSSERYEGAVKTVTKANVCMGQKRRGKAYYHRVWWDGNTCGSVSGKRV